MGAQNAVEPVQGRMSVRALARHVGVDESKIRKAVKNGRIEHGIARVKGRLVITDAALAEEDWHRNRDASKGPPGRIPGRVVTIEEARKRVLTAQAARLEQEHKRRAGQLIDADVERRKDFGIARTVHDNLLNLVSRLTPELMAITDRATFEVRFETGIREALTVLADLLREED